MAAEDVQAQALAWALDETSKACFGEDYGVAVTWGPQPVQTPQGVFMVAAWMLLLTTRSPLIGDGPLFHLAPVGMNLPDEAQVRAQVTDGIGQLRTLRSKKLAGSNGKAPAPAGGRG